MGDSDIPPTSQQIQLNTVCANQNQGSLDYSEVILTCPPPGLKGNTISIRSFSNVITIYEIEVLGKQNSLVIKSNIVHSLPSSAIAGA